MCFRWLFECHQVDALHVEQTLIYSKINRIMYGATASFMSVDNNTSAQKVERYVRTVRSTHLLCLNETRLSEVNLISQ